MSDRFTGRGVARWVPALVLGVGLLLRLVWALIVPVQPVSDSHAYDMFARNLVACGTYGWQCNEPSAYWPPGTSFLYAGLFALFGFGYRAVVAMNLAFFAGTAWLTMRLGRESFGERVGWLAATLLALWPSQIQFTTVLASEQPFTFAVVAGLVFWSRARWPWWRVAILAGPVFAAACLFRPTALLIPGLLAAADVVRTRRLTPALPKAAALYLVLFAALAPWTLRNLHLFGHPVLVSTNGGANLWMGNHDQATGGYADLPPEALRIPNEAERDKFLGGEAKTFILHHPISFLSLSVHRVITTYKNESIGVVWNGPGLVTRLGPAVLMPLKILNMGYWWLVLLAALAGIVVLARSEGLLAVCLAPAPLLWGYFTAVHAIIVAQDRYHFPSIPFIAILAGLFIDRVAERGAWPAAFGAQRRLPVTGANV